MDRRSSGMSAGLALMALWFMGVRVFGHDTNVPKEVLTMKNPVASSDAVLAKATTAYEENCLMCHGEKGAGDGPMAGMLKDKPADLGDPKLLGEMTDGEIYWIITKGVKPMPPFETKLSDEERWNLVHLMRKMSKTKPNTTPHKGH